MPGQATLLKQFALHIAYGPKTNDCLKKAYADIGNNCLAVYPDTYNYLVCEAFLS